MSHYLYSSTSHILNTDAPPLTGTSFRYTFPQLVGDFQLPPEGYGKVHSGPFLWIASAGHYEFM